MVSNSLVVKSPQKRLACLFFSDILLATWLDVSWSFWKLDHRGAKSDQTSDSQITRECQGKQVGDSTISHLFINTDYDGGAWYYCVTSEGSDTINKVIISICSFCTTEQKLTFCPKAQLLWGSKDPKIRKVFLSKTGAFAYQPTPTTVFGNHQKSLNFHAKVCTNRNCWVYYRFFGAKIQIYWIWNSMKWDFVCLFQTLCNNPLFAKKKTSKGIRLWSGFLCRFILP